jgi:hypothetical protein
MTEAEFNQAVDSGNVNTVPPTDAPALETKPPVFDDFEPVLQLIRNPRIYLPAAPTFQPTSFAESIQFVDDGTSKTVYFFINGSWVTPTFTPSEIQLHWSKSFSSLSSASGVGFNASDGSATRLMVANGTAVYTFRRFGTSDGWMMVGNSSVGSSLDGYSMCYHDGAFLAGGGTTVYELTDSDTPTQTACTVSGTTLAAVLGIASDGTNVYILTDSTTVKQFTKSGTILTYVGSITLATSVALGLHVDGSYIYSHDNTSPVLTLYKFTLAGANDSNQTFQSNASGLPIIKNIIKGPDGGLWINLISTNASSIQSTQVLKKCSF